MLAARESVAQKTARYVLIGLLLALGAWMLRHFLSALCWAVVLAIATAPLYDRWLARLHGRRRHVWAALTFTLAVGIILIVPLAYGGVIAVREAIALVRSVAESAANGAPPLPHWILDLPWLGTWVRNEWISEFGHGAAAAGAVARVHPAIFEWTRLVGTLVARRVSTLVFTLLTLYFVYLKRDALRQDVPRVIRAVFGPDVAPLLHRAGDAVRATVDGIVLVAVGEGAVMYGVYAVAGAPHPVLLGAVTGVFAMVPFAAPLVFGAVAAWLSSQDAIGAAVGVAIAGGLVLFAADNFVRPALIGGGARLPFLWVLLGILGGVESFGLVGLFLGPALMAALVSLWRTWAGTADPQSR